MSLHPIRNTLLTAGLCLLFSIPANALESDKEKLSYALGVQIGAQIMQSLNQQGIAVETEDFVSGLSGFIQGKTLLLSEEEIFAILTTYQNSIIEQGKAIALDNSRKGDAYREDYADKKGVQKTSSGLLYEVIVEGNGNKPKISDTVVVHYSGSLIDGTEFDSSYTRDAPATFGLQGVIPGWGEILQLMPTGSTWNVVIPPELAYGEGGSGPVIPPNATLVFKIELIEIR